MLFKKQLIIWLGLMYGLKPLMENENFWYQIKVGTLRSSSTQGLLGRRIAQIT